MNALKSTMAVMLLACMPLLSFAQESKSQFRPMAEIAEVEEDEGLVKLEVFKMLDNGQYYLSVGTLGIGDELIQIDFDPVSELFIPLGDNLTDAMESLSQLQAMYKQPRNTSIEVMGCLSIVYPSDNLEPVKVTYLKVLLSNLLEFSIQRPTFVRATHINKSAFNSLMASMKIHQKLHPKD